MMADNDAMRVLKTTRRPASNAVTVSPPGTHSDAWQVASDRGHYYTHSILFRIIITVTFRSVLGCSCNYAERVLLL